MKTAEFILERPHKVVFRTAKGREMIFYIHERDDEGPFIHILGDGELTITPCVTNAIDLRMK